MQVAAYKNSIRLRKDTYRATVPIHFGYISRIAYFLTGRARICEIDIFCWSLINQFLDLLGFQRVDISKDTIPNQEQSAEQHSNESSLIHNTNLPEERKTSIRSMILPHSDDCCYHCAYWNGDRKTFGAYTTPTYGICLKYNRREQLSSDLACNDYKKRKKLSGDW